MKKIIILLVGIAIIQQTIGISVFAQSTTANKPAPKKDTTVQRPKPTSPIEKGASDVMKRGFGIWPAFNSVADSYNKALRDYNACIGDSTKTGTDCVQSIRDSLKLVTAAISYYESILKLPKRYAGGGVEVEMTIGDGKDPPLSVLESEKMIAQNKKLIQKMDLFLKNDTRENSDAWVKEWKLTINSFNEFTKN